MTVIKAARKAVHCWHASNRSQETASPMVRRVIECLVFTVSTYWTRVWLRELYSVSDDESAQACASTSLIA